MTWYWMLLDSKYSWKKRWAQLDTAAAAIARISAMMAFHGRAFCFTLATWAGRSSCGPSCRCILRSSSRAPGTVTAERNRTRRRLLGEDPIWVRTRRSAACQREAGAGWLGQQRPADGEPDPAGQAVGDAGRGGVPGDERRDKAHVTA